MPVPDYQSLMRPVLVELADGQPRAIAELRERVADSIGLTPEDRQDEVPSGQKPLYHDRISWAVSYLKQAKVVERPKRGVYALTDRGKQVLQANPTRVDNQVLRQFPEFEAFLNRSNEASKATPESETAAEQKTPEESLQSAYGRLRSAMESELLDQVKAASPQFFERLVVELLVAMGYGGSLKDAGEAIGRSGDEGIDGIIKEDRLGLDRILIQAKRWTSNTVGRPDVQSFAGSLEGARAKKGIFITTSAFSADARAYVDRIEKRIVLIDGEELAGYLYEHGVGVTTTAKYEVKRVDSDYFVEE
jgi:restriction system protein